MAKKLAVLTGLVLVVGLLVFNGGQTGTADLSAGLVGYWKFDEGSGSLALDSASGNTGTINGGAVYREPKWDVSYNRLQEEAVT